MTATLQNPTLQVDAIVRRWSDHSSRLALILELLDVDMDLDRCSDIDDLGVLTARRFNLAGLLAPAYDEERHGRREYNNLRHATAARTLMALDLEQASLALVAEGL